MLCAVSGLDDIGTKRNVGGESSWSVAVVVSLVLLVSLGSLGALVSTEDDDDDEEEE